MPQERDTGEQSARAATGGGAPGRDADGRDADGRDAGGSGATGRGDAGNVDRAGAGRRRPEISRDRDLDGRARNSRPRDALGRPLPYGSPDVPRAPEGVLRTPAETIAQAQQLLDSGLPFHAHEVFEDAWKTAGVAADSIEPVNASSSAAADRGLWKGLAQIAVGLTHLARGDNDRGAQTLLRRGAAAVEPYWRQSPYGLDISGIVRWAGELADGLARAAPKEAGNRWTAPRLLREHPVNDPPG